MFKRLLKFFLDQLFPLKCIGCGQDDIKICNDCVNSIKIEPKWLDFRLSSEALAKEDDLRVWSAYHYEGKVIQKLIQKWKYNGDKEIVRKLVDRIKFPDNVEADLIVPVPLHRRRGVERGFNQAEQVARIVAEKFLIPVSADLIRSRYTKAQAQLKKEERQTNLKDVFIWKGDSINGKTIILVDDVVTTGSTLIECQKALLKAGAGKVIGICLLRGGMDK